MLQIERFVCNPFQENCYIVSDETGEAVIVDCGAFFPEERKAVTDYIHRNNLKVKHLVTTHGHIDHNFGNDTIAAEFGLRPEVSQADVCLMGKLKEQAMLFANISLDYVMPPIGRCFAGGDTVSFGTHTFDIISTPGHTPGSVFLYCKDEKIAFSGDTLFNMSIGRTDFELGSYHDIIDSLARVSRLLPDDVEVLPGHGPKTTMGQEKQFNPYLNMV